MLVLTRRVGERVLVGDEVVITVVRINPNAVRIGIQAPKDMNIVREELMEAIGDPNGIEIELTDESPVDGVTVPGGCAVEREHSIQVDVSEPDDIGRRSLSEKVA